MDGRCEVVDGQMGRCRLDADGHAFPGVHAYEKVPGPPGPPQKWQVGGKAAMATGNKAAPTEEVETLSEIDQLRADLAYAQADARHWHEAYRRMDAEALRWSRQVREYAKQAREGERLRRRIRSLVGDWPTVETYRLRHALGDECHECCDFCHYHGCRCGDE